MFLIKLARRFQTGAQRRIEPAMDPLDPVSCQKEGSQDGFLDDETSVAVQRHWKRCYRSNYRCWLGKDLLRDFGYSRW